MSKKYIHWLNSQECYMLDEPGPVETTEDPKRVSCWTCLDWMPDELKADNPTWKRMCAWTRNQIIQLDRLAQPFIASGEIAFEGAVSSGQFVEATATIPSRGEIRKAQAQGSRKQLHHPAPPEDGGTI